MSEGTGKSQAGLRAAKNYAPPGFNNIAPYILVKGAAEFIEFLKGAFAVTERVRVAQPDGSTVSTLCPTPGTTVTCPCGNCEITETAFAVGVRMSRLPERASTGTSGKGPAARGAFPAGEGQKRQ